MLIKLATHKSGHQLSFLLLWRYLLAMEFIYFENFRNSRLFMILLSGTRPSFIFSSPLFHISSRDNLHIFKKKKPSFVLCAKSHCLEKLIYGKIKQVGNRLSCARFSFNSAWSISFFHHRAVEALMKKENLYFEPFSIRPGGSEKDSHTVMNPLTE